MGFLGATIAKKHEKRYFSRDLSQKKHIWYSKVVEPVKVSILRRALYFELMFFRPKYPLKYQNGVFWGNKDQKTWKTTIFLRFIAKKKHKCHSQVSEHVKISILKFTYYFELVIFPLNILRTPKVGFFGSIRSKNEKNV